MIYVVDDESGHAFWLVGHFRIEGVPATLLIDAASAYLALMAAAPNPDDAVLVDLMLSAGPAHPDIPDFFDGKEKLVGLRLAKALFDADPVRFRGRMAIFTAFSNIPAAAKAWLECKGIPIIEKGIDFASILAAIDALSRGNGAIAPVNETYEQENNSGSAKGE